ncbi:aminoglycoside adenylyltransferase family protein [Cupriavidus sp. AU9028]|uniref:aminoglycoside adenylyltransferase family protein n=1 Tax=Cupriavidus sp. AU9028 TaxID=2871157 RepID=UPI001C973A19|nr:aminoglycoside adenylyltransferase family protein [Cupriavidus sp. AU9028]MBY4896642.1 DUF4111 domain-containing protein [Cupriavidus sp. AU9028]
MVRGTPENPTLPDHRALQQARAAVEAAQRHLGPALLAAWLYGSAADGGLRTHSDIDLLLLIEGGLPAPAGTALTANLLYLSGIPGDPQRRPLELTIVDLAQIRPWRYPAIREYQFGEWLRAELLQGATIERQRDPDLALLLTAARQHSHALWGPSAAQLLDPVPERDRLRAMREMLPELAENWEEDPRNAVLTLCRMLVTAVTGDIVPKDQAATWVLRHFPGPHARIVGWARAEYLGENNVGENNVGERAHSGAAIGPIGPARIAVQGLADLVQARLDEAVEPRT